MGCLVDKGNTKDEVGSLTDDVSKVEKESEHKGSFLIRSDSQERVPITMVDRYFLVGEGMLSSTECKTFHNEALWKTLDYPVICMIKIAMEICTRK